MDQGEVRDAPQDRGVGRHVPPPAPDVSGLMFELLEWWNTQAAELSPVLSSAILHYQFEWIHPSPTATAHGTRSRCGSCTGADTTATTSSVDEYYWRIGLPTTRRSGPYGSRART